LTRSMTGFGRSEYTSPARVITVEIKSVNHRYSEILIRMPRQYSLLEEQIKRNILKQVFRGRVEVYIKVENTQISPDRVQVDKELAVAYYRAMKELAMATGLAIDAGITDLSGLPGVMSLQEKDENLEEIMAEFAPAVSEALAAMLEMREIEGKKLALDLRERLSLLMMYRDRIEIKSPEVTASYQEKLRNRLRDMMENEQIDETRFTMEIALFADRSNIDEELVRLKSHFDQFINILQEKGAFGRKLDFLIQEINREVNTIGSKANDLEITKIIVEMKSELEKVREQVQNIE